MEWVVLGGICVVIVVLEFAKHVYYVAKNVWAVRRAFDKPTRVLPPLGVVTINGIVSGIGEEIPVQVTIREDGNAGRGQIFWKQALREVNANSFALLVPEVGARIIVEPGDDVQLRSAARVTDWDNNYKPDKLCRFRTATLHDGDRAIVTGVFSEKREVEPRASEYRSEKGKLRMEYVLRPIPSEPMRIDSETLLEEIRERLGYIGWARALGVAIVPYFYVRGLSDVFADLSGPIFSAIVMGYALIRLFVRAGKLDRTPWFERRNDPKNPHYSAEDIQRS